MDRFLSFFPPRERPVSSRSTGIAEAVLRLNPNSYNIKRTLLRAATKLFHLFPNETIHCDVTANIILKQKNQFSIYYGQRYKGRKISYGQEWDPETGELIKQSETFELNAPGDAEDLPTSFSREEFGSLFAQNFASSAVKIVNVVSIVYIFTKVRTI